METYKLQNEERLEIADNLQQILRERAEKKKMREKAEMEFDKLQDEVYRGFGVVKKSGDMEFYSYDDIHSPIKVVNKKITIPFTFLGFELVITSKEKTVEEMRRLCLDIHNRKVNLLGEREQGLRIFDNSLKES